MFLLTLFLMKAPEQSKNDAGHDNHAYVYGNDFTLPSLSVLNANQKPADESRF